jgi:hypothetical protein
VNRTRGTQTLWRWFRDSRDSEMIVIFGEQLAALLGLAAALLAVALSLVTGDPFTTRSARSLIGVLLVVVAVFVAIEVKALLIGQSVSVERREAIRAFLEARPEITTCSTSSPCRWAGRDGGGPGQPRRRAAIRRQLVRRINAVEVDLRVAFPDVRWSFFEPDDSD